MDPEESVNDRPEDASENEEIAQGHDAPQADEQAPGRSLDFNKLEPGEEPEPGNDEPNPGGDEPERTGVASSRVGDADRALKGASSGVDFDYLAGLREMINKNLRPSFGALDAIGRQQASWARTFVVPDFSSVVPKWDFPKYAIPKLDLPAINFPALDAATRQMSESVLAGFDFGKFFPKVDFGNLLKFEPAGGWDEWWLNWWPPNWPRDIDVDAMQAILNDEALPLVWVPRAEIVTEVLAAETREDRVAVLVAKRAEVAEDCQAALADVDHPRLLPQRRLLASAVDALAAGHDDAAQSLAVLVAETAVLQAAAAGHLDGVATPRKLYNRVRDAVRINLDEAPVWTLRVLASLAPVAGFFTPYFPHKGDVVPEGMSRHVTVHFAFDEHYTEEHAVVAVLLMTSVVRGLQQGWAIWEPDRDTEPEDDGTEEF